MSSADTSAVAHYETLVIGAGAAGMLAAARSAERGRATLLVEKSRKAGVKILISGGTRCNLTHDCDVAGIVAAFGSSGSFLHSPLAALGPRQLLELFHAEGVPTKVEPGGKVFPLSDRAIDVRDALQRRLTRCGAELSLGEAVVSLQRSARGFDVQTQLRQLSCERLIVTTGGKSYPGCGTTGDAYAWLAALGHTIRRPRPALVPLISPAAWVTELAGITIPDAGLRVVDPRLLASSGSQRTARRRHGLPAGVLIERRGSLLFTHFGLSGPVALDVSRAVTGADDPRQLCLRADFLPEWSEAQLDEWLGQMAREQGKKQVIGLLPEAVPRRLATALFAQANVPSDQRAAELSKPQRRALVEWLKSAELPVSGSRGFDKAEVTAGGVALDEVDSRSMQSKLVPGLYLAGEVLDLDGFIGGYNFQAAFSTGYLAGSSV